MRFVTPAQTLAEYKHQKMPIFETLGLSTGGAILLGGALAAGGSVGAALISSQGRGGGGGGGMPQYNPQNTLELQKQQFAQMGPQALDFGKQAFDQAANQGIDFAKRGTQANIENQKLVTPGSFNQRQVAQRQINQYIKGNIPLDVQQSINRQVAQNLGGGYNLYSGGGQAPQNFARNLGQTSLGLSQFGLSAAPTWQQLANSMVVRPEAGLSAGISATGIGGQMASAAAQYANSMAESQYQSGFNQYQANQLQNQANQLQNQQLGQMISAGAGAASQALNSYAQYKYYDGLSGSMQGRLATVPATNTALGSGQYIPGSSEYLNSALMY